MFSVCTLMEDAPITRMDEVLQPKLSAHYGGVSGIWLSFSCLLFAYCLWGSG